MSFVRCVMCRGQKKVRGLGSMIKKCNVCEGVGYVESVDDTQDVQDVEDSPIVVVKKKSHWSKKA